MSFREFEPRCEHLDDAAAYALGALEESEVSAFRVHLDGCAVCRREIAELGPVVSRLPMSATPRTAPAQLRDRVMAVVRSEAELLNAAGAGADRAPAPARRSWTLRPLVAAAAAAMLVVGIAVGVALSGGGTAVHQVSARVVPVGASAVLRQTGDRAELIMSRMPPPPRGRVYELWVQRGVRAPSPTDALFVVGRSGHAAIDVPGSLHGVTRMMVTSEPPGGSLTPSTAPLLTVSPASS